MSMSHIFPQGMLAAITLLGGGARDEGTRAGARCELRLLLCSVASTTLLGAELSPMLIQKKPCGLGLNWLDTL